MIQNIQIEAVDTLFFRDGRPFTMGEDTAATGPFPPNPGVTYGALRTAIASKEGIEVQNIEEATKSLEIQDYYLFTHSYRYYPAPLDLVISKEKKDTNKAYHLFPRQAQTGFISNGGQNPEWWLDTDEPAQQVGGKMINDVELTKYLNVGDEEQAIKEFSLLDKEAIFETEFKTGIARAGFTRTVVHGNLYRVAMVRPISIQNEQLQSVAIRLQLKTEQKREFSKTIKLGGEAKQARLSFFDPKFRYNFPQPANSARFFKIYLKTPAIFLNDCYPNLKQHFGIDLHPIAWAVGKPTYIGGFDMKKRQPKPMYMLVPGGSVFYYRLPENIPFKMIRDKTPKVYSISDERAQEGFGLFEFGQLPFDRIKRDQ